MSLKKAWETYLEKVNLVNLAYSTQIQKGYDTDRGRTYLKYGEPNAISESYNEPATYPYEIWHYYDLGNGQRNKKFVFYTRDMEYQRFFTSAFRCYRRNLELPMAICFIRARQS
ncbi:MAG: GWxTD domain-containing protein [Bacteroidales bacterium]